MYFKVKLSSYNEKPWEKSVGFNSLKHVRRSKILNYVINVVKICLQLLYVFGRNYILLILKIKIWTSISWSSLWAVLSWVRNTNFPSIDWILCILCAYYIFQMSVSPLKPKSVWPDFTHTLLQYSSLRLVDVFSVSGRFRAYLRSFPFSFLDGRRSCPTAMAAVQNFSSRYFASHNKVTV